MKFMEFLSHLAICMALAFIVSSVGAIVRGRK